MVAAGTWNWPSETVNTFQFWESVGLRVFRRRKIRCNFPRLSAKRCGVVHHTQHCQVKLYKGGENFYSPTQRKPRCVGHRALDPDASRPQTAHSSLVIVQRKSKRCKLRRLDISNQTRSHLHSFFFPLSSSGVRSPFSAPSVQVTYSGKSLITPMNTSNMLRTWTILLLTVALLAAPLFAAPMSKEDREHLLVHFEMTTQMVAEQVRGLSPAQLEYKASPDRWSIREVVSHLAVAEPDYWRDIQKALKAAPDMKDKKSMATDADILWYGIDRVVHTKTGGGHEKVDTYKDMGEALGKFQALRATMIDYLKTTDDDMRAHSFGDKEVIDCWQWMLEISTHAERHIQQIREIKNEANFPKK